MAGETFPFIQQLKDERKTIKKHETDKEREEKAKAEYRVTFADVVKANTVNNVLRCC